MKTAASIIAALLAVTTVHAGVLVGWTQFETNGVGRADDGTPDTAAAGFSGLLGVNVNPSATTQGGGREISASYNHIGNDTYGSAYTMTGGEDTSATPIAGIRLDTFSTDNRYIDINVMNNSGAPIDINGVHFDVALLFGTNFNLKVSHFYAPALTPNPSDLTDAFPQRAILNTDVVAPGFAWQEFDVSTEDGGMPDVTLADGERAAFRIFITAIAENVGVKVDNIAIATSTLAEQFGLTVDYEFDEPAGGLSTAVDSASSSANGWNDDAGTNVFINGNGRAVITGNMTKQNNFLASSSTSGTAFLRVDYPDWSGPDKNTTVGMRLRNQTLATNLNYEVTFRSGTGTNGNLNIPASSISSSFEFLQGNIPNDTSILSVNYNTGTNAGIQAIDSGEEWGIFSTPSWVNAGYYTGLLPGGTVGLQTGGAGGASTLNMGAALNDTGFKAGLWTYAATPTPAFFQLTNLLAQFPDGYDVYVYVNGYSGPAAATNIYAPLNALVDGVAVPTRYVDFCGPCNFNDQYVNYTEITSTNSAAPTLVGNYVKYASLTADTFAFQVATSINPATGSPEGSAMLAGFQVVPADTSYLNGLSLILGVDTDNDTWSVWWDKNITGTYTQLRADEPINFPGGITNVDQVNALILNGSTNTIGIDRILLGTDFDVVAAFPEEYVSPAAPTLSISSPGGVVTVTWDGDKLESAGVVTGPWSEVVGAPKPYLPPAASSEEYYRAVNE